MVSTLHFRVHNREMLGDSVKFHNVAILEVYVLI